jgi:hypothetical protein
VQGTGIRRVCLFDVLSVRQFLFPELAHNLSRGSAIRVIVSRSEGQEHARQKRYESQFSARAQGPLRAEVSRLRNSYFDALWESEQPAEAKRE